MKVKFSIGISVFNKESNYDFIVTTCFNSLIAFSRIVTTSLSSTSVPLTEIVATCLSIINIPLTIIF